MLESALIFVSHAPYCAPSDESLTHLHLLFVVYFPLIFLFPSLFVALSSLLDLPDSLGFPFLKILT